VGFVFEQSSASSGCRITTCCARCRIITIAAERKGKSREKAEQIDLETFAKNVFDHGHGHLNVKMSVHQPKQEHGAANVDEHGRSAETMDRSRFDKIRVGGTAIFSPYEFAAHHSDVANADYRDIPLITVVRSK
jgi:hypothetical protein